MTQEEEIRALLEAIGEAHLAACRAYEFSEGSSYAHASVVTATKVVRLARAALGTKEDWHGDGQN